MKMEFEIVAWLYPGLQNPTVRVNRDQLKQIFVELPLGKQISVRAPGASGRLGYSGFKITAESEDALQQVSSSIPTGTISIHIDSGVTDFGVPGSELPPEQWLADDSWKVRNLWEPNRVLESRLANLFTESVDAAKAMPIRFPNWRELTFSELVSIVSACTQGEWQDPIAYRWRDNMTGNNCYNFATGYKTDTKAEPGRGGGVSEQAPLRERLLADGLQEVNHTSSGPLKPLSAKIGHYLAAFVDPASPSDYHCYRQLDNGMWAHKMGQSQVRNWDHSCHQISNVEICDSDYFEFIGYFKILDCLELSIQ